MKQFYSNNIWYCVDISYKMCNLLALHCFEKPAIHTVAYSLKSMLTRKGNDKTKRVRSYSVRGGVRYVSRLFLCCFLIGLQGLIWVWHDVSLVEWPPAHCPAYSYTMSHLRGKKTDQ